MTILEKLPQGAERLQDEDEDLEDMGSTEESTESVLAAKKVSIVDAMAEVQSLQKHDRSQTVASWLIYSPVAF